MYSLKRYQGVRIVLIFNDFLYFQRWGETFYIPRTLNGRDIYKQRNRYENSGKLYKSIYWIQTKYMKMNSCKPGIYIL